jgi:DNA-binding response OmpR family regulator
VARILVVDDEPRVLRFILDVLCRAGHEAHGAADAEAALAGLLAARPDLFVFDIHLPGMDGLSLARKLRRLPATKPVPVIVISGRTEERHKLDARASGAITFLEKPFRPGDLLAAVSLAIGMGRRRRK